MAKHPAGILRFKRTKANFLNAPYIQYDFPMGGAMPYRRAVEWKMVWWKRLYHFFSVKGTLLRKCVRPALFIGSLAALWSWFESVVFSDVAKMGSEEAMVKLNSHLDKLTTLHEYLLVPATFVVVFTLNECMNRWQVTLTAMWSLQDPIQASGFMLGSVFAKASAADRELAFKMYRYMQVVHILSYSHLAACFSELDMDDLVICGLLTPEEGEWLVRDDIHTDGQRRRVLAWLWDVLWLASKKDIIGSNFGRIEKFFTKIREMGGTVGCEYGRDLPFRCVWAGRGCGGEGERGRGG